MPYQFCRRWNAHALRDFMRHLPFGAFGNTYFQLASVDTLEKKRGSQQGCGFSDGLPYPRLLLLEPQRRKASRQLEASWKQAILADTR